MDDLTAKKSCDLPHGYVLYEVRYTRSRGTLSTGDGTRELDTSRRDAREGGSCERVDAGSKQLRMLDGESKSFTNDGY